MRNLLSVSASRGMRHLRLSTVMLTCFVVTACMHWTPPPNTSVDFRKQLEANRHPVRITLLTGERVTFKNALVQRDSVQDAQGLTLRNWYEPGLSSWRKNARAISLLQIQKIELRKLEPVGTFLVGVGTAVFAYSFYVFVAQGGALGGVGVGL
jgi:heme A synthase